MKEDMALPHRIRLAFAPCNVTAGCGVSLRPSGYESVRAQVFHQSAWTSEFPLSLRPDRMVMATELDL